jgi:hypothetical protein
MTMPRWRLTMWAFLMFNVVMVGLMWLFLWLVLNSSSWCDYEPGACAWRLGLFDAVRGLVAVAIVWPIGVVVIWSVWLHGARRARVDGTVDGCLIVGGAIAITIIGPLIAFAIGQL